MRKVRHLAGLVALFMPLNMVWVFLACALSCTAATESSCATEDCCAVVVVAGEAVSSSDDSSCLLVPMIPATKVEQMSRTDVCGVSDVAIARSSVEVDARQRSEVTPSVADPPPKPSPIDRFQALRV